MRSRADTLKALLEFVEPRDQILADLHPFEWDSDVELATLLRANVIQILRRFVAGALTCDEVEDWANLVESREDIGFEPGHDALVRDVVFQLANPLLNAAITPELAERLLARLRT
jgi:hypothetical protein